MAKVNHQHLPKGGNFFSAWLGRSILKLRGWKLDGEFPDHAKMVVAVGPHTSNWDFFLGLAVLFSLRIQIKFLGKHTIFVPVIKQLLQLIGGIPVNRKAKHGVVQEIANIFDSREKLVLALAPEGTRSPIFPWKSGFLAIAHKAKVPVALIGFDFEAKRIRIGPVFYTSENQDEDMQKVYQFFKTVKPKYPRNVKYNSK